MMTEEAQLELGHDLLSAARRAPAIEALDHLQHQAAEASRQLDRHHHDVDSPAPAAAQLLLAPKRERALLAILEQHRGQLVLGTDASLGAGRRAVGRVAGVASARHRLDIAQQAGYGAIALRRAPATATPGRRSSRNASNTSSSPLAREGRRGTRRSRRSARAREALRP